MVYEGVWRDIIDDYEGIVMNLIIANRLIVRRTVYRTLTPEQELNADIFTAGCAGYT